MTLKALTLGSAVIDIIVTIDPERIEQMQMRNADTSFLLVEEGRKVDAESITRHIGGGGVNTAVSLARLGFDTATLVKTGDDRNREDVTTRLKDEVVHPGQNAEDLVEVMNGLEDALESIDVLIGMHLCQLRAKGCEFRRL